MSECLARASWSTLSPVRKGQATWRSKLPKLLLLECSLEISRWAWTPPFSGPEWGGKACKCEANYRDFFEPVQSTIIIWNTSEFHLCESLSLCICIECESPRFLVSFLDSPGFYQISPPKQPLPYQPLSDSGPYRAGNHSVITSSDMEARFPLYLISASCHSATLSGILFFCISTFLSFGKGCLS